MPALKTRRKDAIILKVVLFFYSDTPTPRHTATPPAFFSGLYL